MLRSVEAGASLVAGLARYVAGLRGPGTVAERDGLLLHVFDTLGVLAAGLRTEEAAAARAAAGAASARGGAEPRGSVRREGLLDLPCADLALVLAVAARMSEVDDIDLASCTTPGSVAVTTALALAAAGERRSVGAGDFLAAVRCGYEVTTAVGVLVDGPRVLRAGIWPTCVAAAAGAAAVAARLWRLSRRQAADALGTALAMAHGPGVRGRGTLSVRWLLLGSAVRGGILAAAGARAGFGVDDASAARALEPVVPAAVEAALARLGKRLPGVGMKPFVVARQSLAAVEGFAAALERGGIAPGDVREVEVAVPEPWREMVARLPASGRESVASAAYRCALAALHPADLHDVARRRLRRDAATQALLARVRVVSSPDLTALFPLRWPARVRVTTTAGATWEERVIAARGDPDRPLGWDGVTAKLRALRPTLDAAGVGRLEAAVRRLGATDRGGDDAMDGLLGAVGRLSAG